MNFFNTIDAFKTTPTLANAKKVVAHVSKHPMVLAMMTLEDMAAHTQAQRIVEDAKNPAKTQKRSSVSCAPATRT